MKTFSALAVLFLLPASLAARVVAVGPWTACQGEILGIAMLNAGLQTVDGDVELVDAETGATLDVQPLAVPGGRGVEVFVNSESAFVNRSPEASDGPDCRSARDVVALVRINEPGGVAQPLLIRGYNVTHRLNRAEGDQKTIIGGFKSMSGMDSETEVVEYRVSDPFVASGEMTLRIANWGDQALSLIAEVVRATDGAVVATVPVEALARREARGIEGWGRTVRAALDGSGPYMVRLTALGGAKGAGGAVSIEAGGRLDFYTLD